jgi:transcriptional regulator with XRE-family HTH domain
MIKNEKQYQVTQKKLAEFKVALQLLLGNQEMSPEEIEIRRGFTESQMEVFLEEMQEFEKLKGGKVPWLDLKSFSDISDMLIKARIAKGWNQGELADKLGLKAQQIQRYESTDYETASFARMMQIFDTLELELKSCRIKLGEPQYIIPITMPKPEYDMARERLQKFGRLIATKTIEECVQ